MRSKELWMSPAIPLLWYALANAKNENATLYFLLVWGGLLGRGILDPCLNAGINTGFVLLSHEFANCVLAAFEVLLSGGLGIEHDSNPYLSVFG